MGTQTVAHLTTNVVGPGALTVTAPQPEVRFYARELRVAAQDGKKYFSGYAAVFNSISEDLGGWKEVIRPGAFKNTLASGREIRNLVNHNKAQILGSTLSGTTEIWEDEHGLAFRTLCSDRSYELDLIKSLERGDASRCSFAFSVRGAAGQKWSKSGGLDLRELLDVDLYEVSILTEDPAYAATSAEVVMRQMFPSGIPVELRTYMQGTDSFKLEDGTEITTSVVTLSICACACESCVAGNCENCTNTDCTDELCNCSQGGKDGGDGGDGNDEEGDGEDMEAAATMVAASTSAPAVPVMEIVELKTDVDPTLRALQSALTEHLRTGGTTTDDPSAPFVTRLPLADRRAIHANGKRIRAKIAARKADMEARGARGLEFRSKVDPATNELVLYIYGEIGEDICGDGISTGNIRRAVEDAGDFTSIRLRINSPGGDAFEGVAIGNYLRSLKKPIVSSIDGLAASAASVIALCAHRVEIAPNAMLMCHNASTGAYGYASDLRKVADVLQKISDSIAQTYVKKTGKTLEDIQSLLAAETWMGGAECVAEGFADAVVDPGSDDEMPIESKALAAIRESRLLNSYRNLPEDFVSSMAAAEIEVRRIEAAATSSAEVEAATLAVVAAEKSGAEMEDDESTLDLLRLRARAFQLGL